MSTAGCIYTAAILLDKNAEDRQKELCEIMKEFVQQVREELHFVKADIAEARQEIANITAALCEEEEEGEEEGGEQGVEEGQQAAGIEQNGAETARLIPTLPDAAATVSAPAAMSVEYLQFKQQAETQLAAMEPAKRMLTDQNCVTAIAQATDDATRLKLEEDYKTYFTQEYNYYKAYYDQELAKLSGAPATIMPAAAPVTTAQQETIAVAPPIEQAAPPPAVTQEQQEVTPVTPIKVKPAEEITENEDQPDAEKPDDSEPAAE